MINFFKKSEEEPKNIKEILKDFKELKEEFNVLSGEFDILKKQQGSSIQKVGIIRYNPFKEVGGDQSFSLALLDENNNGVVITSLYSREDNRVYGKPLKNGVSEYPLSLEEKNAIEKACQINCN